MKEPNIKLENKTVEFKKIGQKTNYFEMAIACLENLKPEGITTGGMRTIFKTIDKLEQSDAKSNPVTLTKAEVTAIFKSVGNMTWTIADRQIIEFEEYLQKLIK